MAEENRQLYNTVQDLRGSIRVFCRVRPRGATGDGSAAMVEVSGWVLPGWLGAAGCCWVLLGWNCSGAALEVLCS